MLFAAVKKNVSLPFNARQLEESSHDFTHLVGVAKYFVADISKIQPSNGILDHENIETPGTEVKMKHPVLKLYQELHLSLNPLWREKVIKAKLRRADPH
jgi:hypothetical protein